MNALITLYGASIKEFTRDRLAMFWTIGFPVFFILLLGMVFNRSSTLSHKIGVANLDNGPASTDLLAALQSEEIFEIAEGEQERLLQKLKEGDYKVVITIPADFSETMQAGKPAEVIVYYDEVEVIFDPSSQTTAQKVLTILRHLIDDFEHQFSQNPRLINLSEKSIATNSLRSIEYFLPGILGMSLMQLGLFGTAPQLVQLREQQILRRLGATPLSRVTLLGSQVLLRITFVGIQLSLIILVGVMVFGVSIEGNILHVIGISIMGALLFVALGYLISGIANTQESVHGITSFLNFPMLFLSGLFFPIEYLPKWILPISSAIPLTYLVDALRQIMTDIPGQFSMGLDLTVLGTWLLGCTILAIRLFRWE
jgi:ABC-2 type transport system permease protein